MRSYNPIRRNSQPSTGRLWKIGYVAVAGQGSYRSITRQID
jgi:hypothetical protein